MRSNHVRQVISGADSVQLIKEIVSQSLPDGGGVALVRKRPPSGVARGAVLLLHGLGQNRYAWHLDRRSLSAYLVARGYDVFNLELRGHGRSRLLGSRIADGFEQHVEHDVPAALAAMEEAGHARAFLLGHSLGGALAYATAATQPGRIRGVITVSGVFSWGAGTRAIGAAAHLLAGFDRVHRRLGWRAGLPIRLDLLGRAMAGPLGVLDSPWLPMPAHAWTPGTVERDILREWLTRSFDRTSGSVLTLLGRWARQGSFTDTSGQRDYAAAWRRTDVPVLVLAGDRDLLAHPYYDVKPAFDAACSADRTYRCFGVASAGRPYGHVDLLIGRDAPEHVWPTIGDWLDAR